jgi:hypothetical protein
MVTYFASFMETKGSLMYSKQPTTSLYPEPDESSKSRPLPIRHPADPFSNCPTLRQSPNEPCRNIFTLHPSFAAGKELLWGRTRSAGHYLLTLIAPVCSEQCEESLTQTPSINTVQELDQWIFAI